MTPDQAIELAVQHHRAGNFREAEAIYRQVLAQDPRNAHAMHLLGVIARQANDSQRAVQLITNAIAIEPHVASFHANLADALCQLHRFDEAIVAATRAVQLDPKLPAAHNNLGTALKYLGRFDEAAAEFSEAIRLGNLPEARVNLADTLNRIGRRLQDAGQFAHAEARHQQAIALEPEFADAFNNLGNSLNSQRRTDEALAAYRRAIALNPKFAEPYNNMGSILHNRGEQQAAIDAFETAIRLKPDMAAAFTNLANAKQSIGQLDEALVAAKKAVELWPHYAPLYGNLGNILRDHGDVEEAVEAYTKALELKPDFAGAHDNLCFALHFRADCEPAELLEAHKHWAARHADHLGANVPAHRNTRDPNRPLRIGFVSPDLRRHPVATFLFPLLERHNRANFHFTCYSDVATPDEATHALRGFVERWRDVRKMSDSELAEQICADEIDILVDLALHSANNRLLTFARKPAPLQVSYLGYPGTTGMTAMDYRLTDPHLDPPGAAQPYVERSLTLPRTYWCYSPHPDSPPVAPLPSATSGRITFGCLNSFAKVSKPCLETWKRILDAVPDSRLLLHAAEGSHRQRVREILGERVDFVARQTYADYIRTHSRADISLDPFPYAGGTTTCEALFMGVPVVTLAGEIAVHRSGVSLLTNVGLPELIAESAREYEQIACDLANDQARLLKLRETLRPQMMQSPLMDASGFTRDFEAAFRRIWSEWCSAAAT